MIISLGYRIKSKIATDFRKLATERLKEYIIKGFAIDDDKLKNLGGGNYLKELLDRIRDIRSNEKVFYRQVLDLFATSIDYNANTEEAKLFFATVQNKLHYAVHGQTAAELIYDRVDSEKEFMGLTTFTGDFPTKKLKNK
jgi:DNA-binding protein